jgi:hypothetical protein
VALALAVALAAAAVPAAVALQSGAGDIRIDAHGGFAPRALPHDHDARITLRAGSRISTVSGAQPPPLKTISIDFDRHVSVVTTGLPQCPLGQSSSAPGVKVLARCQGAIVGNGYGTLLLGLREQGYFLSSFAIRLFNGPEKHGNPTVLVWVGMKASPPESGTFIVPIEHIHKGIYGYRADVRIPTMYSGMVSLVSAKLRIGRRWLFEGRSYSYLNARCENGHLQARSEFGFDDGTELSRTIRRPCEVR